MNSNHQAAEEASTDQNPRPPARDPDAVGGPQTDGRQPAGWILLPDDQVPHRWRARAVPLMLVPVVGRELADLLDGRTPSDLAPMDERIVRLLAAGEAQAAIARETGLSLRTVQRRIAVLCRKFDADTTPDLRARLAAAGFANGTARQ